MHSSNISNIFYCPDISDTCTLSDEESRHAVRVLRLKKKDEIYLVDGNGGLFKGEILLAHPKKSQIEILEKLPTTNYQLPTDLHLAVAPTKSSDRFEWFLEKATEIGVTEITPLICEHSERKIVNVARSEKVLVAAMKQSLNLFLPKLNPSKKFSDFFSFSPIQYTQKFIAHYDGKHLKYLYEKGKAAIILIGPEGDFSENEINLAKENGYVEASLGKNRLRTETAAIMACHTIRLMNES